MTTPAAELVAPHQPRPIRFMRMEQVGDWRLKLYGIALPGREPREELVEATLRLAPDVFAEAGDNYGVGFVTVHDSATFGIALYYWWQSANELHQRIYVSPLEDPDALTKLKNPQPAASGSSRSWTSSAARGSRTCSRTRPGPTSSAT